MYDVVIVGGGPAGLSAGLVLGRCRRSVLICDHGKPRNAAAHRMHGYLSRDGTEPFEFLRIGRDEVAQYDVEFRDIEVTAAVKVDECFELTLDGGVVVRCKRLLIATGVFDELPDIEGAQALYGRSLWHCPYCDGWEARDMPLAVYGRAHHGFALALGLLTWSKDLILCSDGPLELEPEHRARLERHGIKIREEKVTRLIGTDGMLERVEFESGDPIERSGMFFSTAQHQVCKLAESLGCRFNDKGTVVTNRNEETGVDGLYVVGDASHDLQFVIVAASEGAKAAVMINTSFQEEESK